MHFSVGDVPAEATPRFRVLPSKTRPISHIVAQCFNNGHSGSARSAPLTPKSAPLTPRIDEQRSPRFSDSDEIFTSTETTPRISAAEWNDGPNPMLRRRRAGRHRTSYSECIDHGKYMQKLAMARTVIGVTMREGGECKVEESVYGAAVLMPQLARTCLWAKTMTILAIQSWFFLFLNIALQAYLLRLMCKEEVIFDGYAGQMFLCDFGANLNNCPGPGCTGPYGTEISGERLYDWSTIAVRRYVKQSLQAVFPEKFREIEDNVDPGEYGLESYGCRLACCFIFMVSCMGDLVSTWKLAQLLYKIPTQEEDWIQVKLDGPCMDDDSDDSDQMNRMVGAINEVIIKVAGMPRLWKVINFILVVMPKLFLWYLTATTGITVLMETSGIADSVTNSVGLTFILSIDELIAETLAAEEVQNFLAATESFPLYDETTSCVGDMSLLTEHEILKKHKETQLGIGSWGFWDFMSLVPHRLLLAVVGTIVFMFNYYQKHCVKAESGDWQISKTVYVPSTPHFDWLNAFLPRFFPHATEGLAWEMQTPN